MRAVSVLRAAFVGCAALAVVLLGVTHVRGGEQLREIKARGTLRWGADQEGGGPFVYPSADDPNRLEGFEVELAEVIAAQLGVEAKFEQNPWDKLPDLVDRGDIDIVLNGYEWSESRAERYGVSIPYYIYELQLLGNKDDETLQTWDDVLAPPNAQPKRIAVLGGSAAQYYLEALGPDRVEIVSFDGASDAMRAVELNVDGIDANLQDLPVWTFYQSGFPKLRAVGEPVGRGYYVAMVKQGEPELLQAVNEAIFAALRDGTLRRIYQKYRMWNQTNSARGLEVNAEGGFTGDQGLKADAEEVEGEQQFAAVRGWGVVRQRGWLLLLASLMTIALDVTAMPLAILAGLALALVRRYGGWLLEKPATLYVEIVRGTPLVLQLYVIFFLLPEIGLSISAFWSAVIGLAINYSAYEAEIYRAGLQAVPRGQMEAALSLGMSRWQALRRVIIPQATRLVIPPVTNDFIALFKDTAVCSVITVVELSKMYYIQARSTGAIVELGLLTALIYLALSYPLSLLATQLERRLAGEARL